MPRDARTQLAIFGAGALARLAYSYFVRDTEYEIVACTVHRKHLASAELNGLPTIPFEELGRSYGPTDCSLFVAVGYKHVNRDRARIFQECSELGYQLPTLISARAHCWADLKIGRNCFVFDAVVIEPNVEIGDDVIVWSGSQISHDTSIGDHAFLGPNAVVLGDVTVGTRSFIGGNATVRNGVTIAEDCVVGAGTVIKGNTNEGDIYSAEQTKPLQGRRGQEQIEL
jgi:sugar O-acyltransferase (sialic acid O-acetyltransferase NeuD family)